MIATSTAQASGFTAIRGPIRGLRTRSEPLDQRPPGLHRATAAADLAIPPARQQQARTPGAEFVLFHHPLHGDARLLLVQSAARKAAIDRSRLGELLAADLAPLAPVALQHGQHPAIDVPLHADV